MEPFQIGLLLCAAVAGGRAAPPRELAPAGKLRFGVVTAPERTAFFVVQGADGEPSGVPVELARALARRAGLDIEFLVAPNSGLVTDALSAGEIDAAFMPVDEERSRKVDFGPAYFIFENTYLVRAGSDIRTIAAVDRPGVRVIGIAGTTTIRTSARLLKQTPIAPVTSVGEALALLAAAKADAFALTRDSLTPLAARVPGARILEGAFHRTGIAIAVPKNRPEALAYVTAFMREAKDAGLVRQAFDASGLGGLAVAPDAPAR
jgi:polar amino acid transport system substrate-binding protein